jgi:hypothetical protein
MDVIQLDNLTSVKYGAYVMTLAFSYTLVPCCLTAHKARAAI